MCYYLIVQFVGSNAWRSFRFRSIPARPHLLMPQLYFENAIGRLYAHPAGYALLRYHAGTRSLLDVQEFLVHTGRLLQRHRWHKLLSDQRQLTPFTETEQALILDFWQARRFLLGATLGAVLPSPDPATLASFTHIWEQACGALRYRLFDDEAQAASWLVAQP